jgi:hypothetical protein
VKRYVTREEFDRACEALWTEVQYQNTLGRRTSDEAKDVPGFLTLLNRTARTTEEHWADLVAEAQPEGGYQVSEALNDLRKLAGIAVRAMIYCGIRNR